MCRGLAVSTASSTTIGATVALFVMCGCSQLLALDDSFQLGTGPAGGAGGAGAVAGSGGTGGVTSVGGESTGGAAAMGATGGAGAVGGTGGASTGGQGGTGGSGTVFFDDFERPDGPAIGNGWIEKVGGAFSLAGGRVTKASTPSTSYRANMVYRPPVEDVLDVEAMVEFDILGPNVFYPQLFVRAQSATIATPNEYVGYLLYVSGSATNAVLGRQGIGIGFVTTLQNFAISPALTTGEIYRLTLKAEGTDPVQLSASIQRFNGSSWQTIGTTTHADSAADRIDTAGAVGFSGDESPDFSYDNFTRADL